MGTEAEWQALEQQAGFSRVQNVAPTKALASPSQSPSVLASETRMDVASGRQAPCGLVWGFPALVCAQVSCADELSGID